MMPMMAVIHLNLPARQLPSGGKGNRREGGGGEIAVLEHYSLVFGTSGMFGILGDSLEMIADGRHQRDSWN